MTALPAPALTEFAAAALRRRGVPDGDATIVAESLVDAELRGRRTHGLMRLPFLLRRLDAGLIDPRPRMEVREARPAVALLDAGNALGAVAGVRAVELASARARAQGVGVVAVRHSNHLGALGFYLRRLTDEGLAGLCFSNTPPAMAPPGGTAPYLGTNPIAAGFPRAAGPVIVDMATSQVARGDVIARGRAGERLPPGWAVDAQGRPTDDPQAALDGSLAPLGGAKGFALALMVEVLTGVLAGAAVGPGVTGTFAPSDRESDVGHSFWALDVGAFAPGFEERIAHLAADLEAIGGRVPGERGDALAGQARRDGIELSARLTTELETLAGAPLGA